MSGPFNRRRKARRGEITPMSAEELQQSLDQLEQEISAKNGRYDTAGSLGADFQPDIEAEAETARKNQAIHEEAVQAGRAAYEREQAQLDEHDPERVNRRQAFERGDRWEIVERQIPDEKKSELPDGSRYWLRSIDRTGGAQLESWFHTREEADQELERRQRKIQEREAERQRQSDWFRKLIGQKPEESD